MDGRGRTAGSRAASREGGVKGWRRQGMRRAWAAGNPHLREKYALSWSHHSSAERSCSSRRSRTRACHGGATRPGVGGDTLDPHGSAPGGHWPVTRGILDPRDYYYRRLITDAVRAIEAVRALPGVDATQVV